MSFRIVATGRAVPAFVLDNERLSHMVDTSDEWITSRTGIRKRHVCTTESLTDLATAAAEAALSQAGWPAATLDLILCATMQGDYVTPSLACMVQKRLAAQCPAFDLNAACTGFLYGLDVADGFFCRKRGKRVLLIAAEQLSKHVDWTDRATCVLFGDGAGAVLLEAGEGLLSLRLGAAGDEGPLFIPGTPGHSPFAPTPPGKQTVFMNGQAVYRFAVNALCGEMERLLDTAGLAVTALRYVLAHQANERILEAARLRLGLDARVLPSCVERYGNTSSSSIPILLDEINRAGGIEKGDLIALFAFGGGLTTGAALLRW